MGEVRAATEGMAPGIARLTAATTAFLDTCLAARTVRALLLDMRSEMQVADEVAGRTAQLTRMVEQDLRAAGWPDPGPAARLYTGMCTETAIAELARGRRDNTLRRSLLHFVSRPSSSAGRAARR
jgi:hypothetical protein